MLNDDQCSANVTLRDDTFGACTDPCASDPDDDSNGICGDVDNCPLVFNPRYEDTDQDGTGDACSQEVCIDIALDNLASYVEGGKLLESGVNLLRLITDYGRQVKRVSFVR